MGAAPTPAPAPATLDVVAALLNVARGLLFVREDPPGSNSGEVIDQALRLSAISPTAPAEQKYWCAAFVTLVGVLVLGARWPLPRTASCDALLAAARRAGVLRATPVPGAVFLRLKTSADADHTGLVETVHADGSFDAVGGNEADPTQPDSRNGIGVFRRRRGRPGVDRARYAFVDLPALLARTLAPASASAPPPSALRVR